MAVMTETEAGSRPTFNDPVLHEQIMRMRVVDNRTNLLYLAGEILGIAAVAGAAIAFFEVRAGWGLAWGWNVPVAAIAVVLLGGFQHRLAGLGHEASHYTLVRNKFLNDLIGDLFCMFPILATLHFYRVFHLAHHQFTNDPERDPDLVSLGGSKMVERFPMSSRWAFARAVYLRGFTEPRSVFRYVTDYMAINTLGSAPNEYLKRVPGADADGRVWPRTAAALGIVYLLAFMAGTYTLPRAGLADWLVPFGFAGAALVLSVGNLLPARAFFPSPFRQPYSTRFGGVLRLLFYTALLTGLAVLRGYTGGRSTAYFWLLWLLPLNTSFPFFMLLRDVYQHTNADDGRLTNSRVFYPDPFTRWAVFVYGQDMHIPHHLFPAIPHYRLPGLHALLKSEHNAYATQVVECHGTFANDDGRPTILDVLCERGEDV
ncbi:MAG: fatty acid desaturase [Isosphaeraceae bacterium]